MNQVHDQHVEPEELLAAIQRVVVDGSRATFLAESGNAMGLANRFLVFDQPGRFRTSMIYGSLGHCAAGVLGAARALAPLPAVALVGDGAMLYTHELHTAVSHHIDNAVWLVLNDARYGSAFDGQTSRGLSSAGLEFPRVDFVAYAKALGADGVTVRSSEHLDSALRGALCAGVPYVVDVWVERRASPLARRFAHFFTPETTER